MDKLVVVEIFEILRICRTISHFLGVRDLTCHLIHIRFSLKIRLRNLFTRDCIYCIKLFQIGRGGVECNPLLIQIAAGELDAGNWISGIPVIDNARLGDQSLLPDDLGKNNPGHNVYYMLPLILGLIGLLWQAFAGKRGIEQFWVVFFLFFMTGIAIVLYLNQPPGQPRERDYAFAGSFYAYAIWIGMGVVGLWNIIRLIAGSRKRASASVYCAATACVLGAAVPIQLPASSSPD